MMHMVQATVCSGSRISVPPLFTRSRRNEGSRRGVLMLAVLVVLAVAALVAGGLMAASEAEHAGLTAMRDRTQQRATAWSGCQAAAALLAAQRGAFADGEPLEIPEEILLFEADGTQAMARMLPVGPAGERLVPEFGKFALAGLDPTSLEATGTVNAAAAQAAVRLGGKVDAIEGIIRPSDGLTTDVVIGPVAAGIASGVRRLQDSSAAGGARGTITARVRGLVVADVATPFSAQRALGVTAGSVVSREPVGDWSSGAMAAIDARTSSGTAARMKAASGEKPPKNQGELVHAMRLAQVPVDQWNHILDAVVAGDDAVERGQVDVSTAPEEVLRAIPALGPERAAKLVQARAALQAGDRGQLAWPVTSGALSEDEFEAAAPFLCARSWLWRMRVATGTVDTAQEGTSMRGIEVWEVVVDLAEDPPRFASIRDCTLLPIAAALAATERQQQVERGERAAAQKSAPSGDPDDGASQDEMATGMANPYPVDASGTERPAYEESSVNQEDSGEGEGDSEVTGDLLEKPRPGPAQIVEQRAAWQREGWQSGASKASAKAAAAQREAERASGVGPQRGVDPPDAIDSQRDQANTDAGARTPWLTLGQREKADRAARRSEWSTLADRAKAERDADKFAWKSLADIEREKSEARSREWKTLSAREQESRQARTNEERARRAAQAANGKTPARGTRWDDTEDLPATDGSVASQPDGSGMNSEQAPSSASSTGGLSGRWRRRSDW